jgi:hypothetical protein
MKGYDKKKEGEKISWNEEKSSSFNSLVKAIDECSKLMF